MKQSLLIEHPDVASNINLINIWLKARMAYSGQPAVSIAIVHDQELVYANGFGMGDIDTGQVATADSIYRIASHSKLFAAISVMQLRDEGKLNLDVPITDYLPWFSIQNEHAQAPPITIRHLMTHTAGLPREAGSGYWVDFKFPSQQEIRGRVADLRKSYSASYRWKYSNLAWGLVGEIIEAVSGQWFNDYVQEHILDPLEMNSTSVTFPADHQERLVTGYGRRMPDGSREVFPFVDALGLASATGMSSCVNDMAKFMAWQFRLRAGHDTEVLTANTLREMQRIHWVQPGWESGWGLGFGIIRQKERDLIGHSGGYPGYLTNTRISSNENIGVCVFTNSLSGGPLEITNRIFEWMAPAIQKAAAEQTLPEPNEIEKEPSNRLLKWLSPILKKPAAEETPPQPTPAWSTVEGTYRDHWGDSHVIFLDGKLQILDPTDENPKKLALELVPQGDGTFIMEGKNGGAAVGERVSFEIGASGQADKVKIGDNTLPRVEF
jgi:D-alanyl-D-alanine carboxypeptidase